jgi:hypothetical protein
MLGIRVALDPRLVSTDAHRRAVPFLCFGALTVELHKLRVIHVGTKRALRFQVCLVAIASQLDAPLAM